VRARDVRSILALLPLLAAGVTLAETNAELQAQVRTTETAFAATMARRDHAAFASFVADDAVFFGSKSVQHGKAEVVAAWKDLYDGAAAPFSWAPAEVEVLASGTLALSSGPVYDPGGRRFGTFTSVWRREKDGRWKIVLDKGNPYCEEAAKP
jgi:ketosteroid isomerase-like protein